MLESDVQRCKSLGTCALYRFLLGGLRGAWLKLCVVVERRRGAFEPLGRCFSSVGELGGAIGILWECHELCVSGFGRVAV